MSNMNNVINCEDKIIIRPIEPSFNDISKQSVDECVNIAKINSLNKKLHNNCANVNCQIANKTKSKCISNGDITSDIMIIDAYPSEYESFTGCLTDEKGYLLNDVLKDTKYKRSDIYCTTVLKCSNVRETDESMVSKCLECYLLQEISIVNPKKIILTFSAFQALLKYKIIPYIGNINYFNKVHCSIANKFESDIYVIYDIDNLNEDQIKTFKQGLRYILS